MTKKIIKRILIAGLVVILSPIILGVLWIGLAWWDNSHPQIGENKPSVEWLPDSASSISYYKSYSFTAYEFDISEESFRTWAKDREIKEISSPFRIMRYAFRTLDCPEYDSNPESPYAKYETQAWATITNGYFFRTPPRPNGGGTYIAYDRNNERAYCQMNPR